MAVRILPLSEDPDGHQPIAALIAETWPGYYGAAGPGDAGATIAGRAHGNGLPFGLVAIAPDGTRVGTVGLDELSFGAEHGETPWIVGLAVASAHRQQGIGGALVGAMVAEAVRRGHRNIYATTTEEALFARGGFTVVRKALDAGVVWTVVRRSLKGHA